MDDADITILLSDAAFNRALAASFYSPDGGGMVDMLSQALEMDGPSRELRLLDPPMIMTLGEGELLATFGVEVSAKIFGRWVEADVALTAQIRAWSGAGTAVLEISDLTLDQAGMGGWIEVPRMVRGALERVLRGYFIGPRGSTVREIALPSITIPPLMSVMSPLELHVTGLAVREGVVAIGLSAATGETGPPPFSDLDRDVTIRLTEPFLEQLLMEAWESIPHRVSVQKRIDVPDYRTFLDAFKGAVDVLLGRGWQKRRVRVDRSWVETEAEIEYGRPQLRLLEGNRVEIVGCPLHIIAHAYPRMEAEEQTPRGSWKRLKEWLVPGRSKPEGRSEVLNLAELAEERDLHIARALAHLSIDPDGAVVVKIDDLELDMELEWGLPSNMVEEASTWLMEQVGERFPPLKVPLPLDQVMVPFLGIAPGISLRRLEGGPGHLDVHADLTFAEVPPPVSPLPRFLADRERMQVHRKDCPSAHAVPESMKVGFYSLHEAFEQGYRGCPDCLFVYSHIQPFGPHAPGDAIRQTLRSR